MKWAWSDLLHPGVLGGGHAGHRLTRRSFIVGGATAHREEGDGNKGDGDELGHGDVGLCLFALLGVIPLVNAGSWLGSRSL